MPKFVQPTNMLAGLFQLSLIAAVYFGIQLQVSVWWWLSSVFCWGFVYTLIGNNMGLHRYFSHGHFTCNKVVEYLMLWTGAMLFIGGPLSYAMTHLVHHKYPDTELDPHGPIRGKRSILMMFQKTVDPKETPIFSRRMMELQRTYGWLHEYYLIFVLINATILYFIDVRVFLFLWWMPASWSSLLIGWAVWRQHIGMKANNTPTANFEPFYEGLHENHHIYPMAPNNAVNPGEIDWTYQYSRLFRVKHNMKGQPK